MHTSLTEENYLKAIFSLSERGEGKVSTNAIASRMQTAAASVSDMLRRLAEKDLVSYEKYRGVQLTPLGAQVAKGLLRKHRLWEVFLMQKLGFAWDEVHEMAEDLEHIDHQALIDRLDSFLGHPKFDPHGDPIPDKDGNIHYHEDILLRELNEGEEGVIVAVKDSSADFLRYLDRMELKLQAHVKLIAVEPFDHSIQIKIGSNKTHSISDKVASNLIIRRAK